MSVRPKDQELALLAQPVLEALVALRAALPADRADALLAPIETYLSVAELVFSQTNPSKIRAAAQTIWIRGLMDHGPKVEVQSIAQNT